MGKEICCTPKPALKRSYGKYDLNPKTVDKPELKSKEFSLTTATALANVWSVGVLMNGMNQGTSLNTRIGSKVLWKKLMFRYRDTTLAANHSIRFLVVYDKQSNGAAPLITDVLQTDSIISFNNLNNRDRFITVIDDTITPDITNSNSGLIGMYSRKINLETIYNGNTGLITDINSGAFYYFVSTTAVSGGFECGSRMRFTDN